MYIVVDAAFELYRAHFAFKHFQNPKGFHNGAMFGFLRSLNSLRKKFPGTYVVAWEGRPKSRHSASAEYKSDREGLPPDLVTQLKPLQNMLRVMGVMQIQHPDWEADDLLATMATTANSLGEPAIIVTGDDDLLQCVVDHPIQSVMVYNPRYKILYHEKEVVDKYKVSPSHLSDLWAIEGDNSDGIPGIKGLGDSFALDLVKRHGDVDYIFNSLDITPEDLTTSFGRKLAILKSSRETVMRNKSLLTLNHSVSDMVIDEPRRDMVRLKDLFLEYGLNSFAKNIDNWSHFNG